MKLRQQQGKDRHSVKVYSHEVAQSKFQEWQEAINLTAKAELTTDCVEQVLPPDMSTTELVIDPVHVSSPSVFWIQYGDGAEEKATRLQEIIGSCQGSLARVDGPGQVKRGELYIAPFADAGEKEACYYRARVNSVFEARVTVFFIDYGNMATVNVQELLVIPPRLIQEHPDMVRIPGLALECSLAKLQPSRVRNSKGLWDEEAVTRFKTLLAEGAACGRLVGTIFSVTRSGSGHSKFLVSLENLRVETSDSARVMEIRSMLLKEQLAEPATESYLSQENHQDRQNYQAYHAAMQRHLDNYAKYETKAVGLRPAKGEARKLNVKVPLNGPFSPLEHKVQCLHRHGSSKMATVDRDSVNSVMLNQSPGDSYDHYMVAALVGMNPTGETLQLRNTSWLPARPGLGAFATMMFSPQVEVRTNSNKTRLTGCVSGLGPRTDWAKPAAEVSKVERTEAFYPAHDIETRFDVNVFNQDINTINKIRYWINLMLSKTEPDQIMRLTQPISLDNAQKGIKKNLEDLLSRERRLEGKEHQPSGQQYRWNMLPGNMRMRSPLAQQELFVYKVNLMEKLEVSLCVADDRWGQG